MDVRNNSENDAYDELLKSFSSNGSRENANDVRNHGEIYFSMNSRAGNKPSAAQNNSSASQSQKRVQSGSSPNSARSNSAQPRNNRNANDRASSNGVNARSYMSEQDKKAKKEVRKKKKRQNAIKNSVIAIIIVILVFVSSFLVKIPIMGCINDILAIDASSDDLSVVLTKDSTAYEVIDILAEKKLINNAAFCKLFIRIMSGYYDRENSKGEKVLISYPKGEYYLNSKMGLEGMLKAIITNGQDSNTIMLTFPEGYSIDQIVEKLDSNGVCSAESLYKVMLEDDLYEKYDFLAGINDKDLRYRALEGFLYPDTYEFYFGESPLSVVEKFLDNFEDKWSDEYSARAAELGYTADEIITVASIIEKEASDSEQMSLVASVLHNRLKSSSFTKLECDSTKEYIDNNKEYLSSLGKYSEYSKVYDTYQTTGLPVGAICCPGAEAIYAALYFEDTNYYFFAHDNNGTIYLAETLAQHENNWKEIEAINEGTD